MESSTKNYSFGRLSNITSSEIILVVGWILAVIQFIWNRSVYGDEANLLKNIIARNPIELLSPLDYGQSAPILFLELERFFYVLFPGSDYGVKFIPLLFYGVSLFLFFRLIKLLFNHDYLLIIALAFLVFNHLLLFYSSEVKQYIVDVFVFVSYYYLLLKNRSHYFLHSFYLALYGALIIWLSNIAPIVLLSAGIFIITEQHFFRQRTKIVAAAFIFSTWLLSFLFYFIFFIYQHPLKEYMVDFWTKANAFLPGNPLQFDFYLFIIHKISLLLHAIAPGILVIRIFVGILCFFGLLHLFQTERRILILLITPILVHFLLSSLKLYPFYLRMVLYQLPILIILFTGGIAWFGERFLISQKKSLVMVLCVAIVTVPIFYFVKTGFPIEREELKDAWNFMEAHVKPTDHVLLAGRLVAGYDYYQHIGIIKPTIPVQFTKSRFSSVADYDGLQGNYWILFSTNYHDDLNSILHELNNSGQELIIEKHFTGIALYYYKFQIK